MENDKYDEEVASLVEQNELFDQKNTKYKEAKAKLDGQDMKTENIKQMITEEGDRLRERGKNVTKKVEAHNKEIGELETRQKEIMAEGDKFIQNQEEVKSLQGEVQQMVADMTKMQGDVQALAAEKKMEEAQKLQEELKSKHAVYTAKDAEFKKRVAEYQLS